MRSLPCRRRPSKHETGKSGPLALLVLLVASSCLHGCAIEMRPEATKSPASERALRRSFDGAPPVIAHGSFDSTCTECHNQEGIAVERVGFAPPTPHELTAGMSVVSRCRQCHVGKRTDSVWRESGFVPLRQDLRSGGRLHAEAPPVLPHPVFMRENCRACHSGPAAREEIRTTHPERTRCRQCHVEQTVSEEFLRS